MKKRRWIHWVIFAALCLDQSGCATVVSGKNQDIQIRSTPMHANVSIDSMITGTTPMIVPLKRSERHTIVVSKPGYQSVTRATRRGFNWWYCGNVILGGVIGLITDPITGAMFRIKPSAIYVELEPDPSKSLVNPQAVVHKPVSAAAQSQTPLAEEKAVQPEVKIQPAASSASEKSVLTQHEPGGSDNQKSEAAPESVKENTEPETQSSGGEGGLVWKKIEI